MSAVLWIGNPALPPSGRFFVQVPAKYLLGRFLDDVITLLSVTLALHDYTLFTLPYLDIGLIYVQIWVCHFTDEPGKKGRYEQRVDKVAAVFALLDLFIAYAEHEPMFRHQFANFVQSLNDLPWIQTKPPAWDNTGLMLRFMICFGFSLQNLLPNTRRAKAEMQQDANRPDGQRLRQRHVAGGDAAVHELGRPGADELARHQRRPPFAVPQARQR